MATVDGGRPRVGGDQAHPMQGQVYLDVADALALAQLLAVEGEQPRRVAIAAQV